MDPKYIIVQAGGKGTRMQSLTRNKPKALVPVNNLPMIFHLFKKYPEKKFIVIGDYKYEVLEKYLRAFAEVDYDIVCATGHEGTCAGLRDALHLIPEGEEVAIIWCDIILPDDYTFPKSKADYVGISGDFPCRWSYENGCFKEEKSTEHGVAGFFILNNKSALEHVPEDGELVRWMRDNGLKFEEQVLSHAHEYGLYSEWKKTDVPRCRPFNAVEVRDGKFIKRPVNEQGREIAGRECAWYKAVHDLSKENADLWLPKIYSYDPLTMEYIEGKNLYEYTDIPDSEKKNKLEKIVDLLKNLHLLGQISADKESFDDAYIGKTIARLEKVRDLIPFADQAEIIINGKSCRNIFFHWDEVRNMVGSYLPKEFVFIHGDCTFSNMMLKDDEIPILIDPRGYFGHTLLYGDEAYDWAKLYYSLISNYDQFNLRRFALDIGDADVSLSIESSHWEDMEGYFFSLLQGRVSRKQMKLYLAILWLSLTTYAWEDYDSICGAFYQGLIYLEEAFLTSEESTGDNYFAATSRILSESLKNLDKNRFESLIDASIRTLRNGNKIVFTGLGKNVPVCEKVTGTLNSLGLSACFMHTNTAVHGDLGLVKPGDMVIILSKSGNTDETIYLAKHLLSRDVTLKCLTFSVDNTLSSMIGRENNLYIPMEHEGDMWNIIPNNSTTLNLIILQGLAMSIAERMQLERDRDFGPNHPGGAIGKELRNEL